MIIVSKVMVSKQLQIYTPVTSHRINIGLHKVTLKQMALNLYDK